MQLGVGLAALEVDGIFLAIAAHVDLDARGERVDDRHAHAMQATGHLVALAAELAAGVQDGQNHLDGGDLLLGMLLDGDASAVVRDRDGVVRMDPHLDMGAEAGQRLVHGVVDDLVHQMMQAARTGGSDVHAGALAHRLETLEDLDVLGTVMPWFVRHRTLLRFFDRTLSQRYRTQSARRQRVPGTGGRGCEANRIILA